MTYSSCVQLLKSNNRNVPWLVFIILRPAIKDLALSFSATSVLCIGFSWKVSGVVSDCVCTLKNACFFRMGIYWGRKMTKHVWIQTVLLNNVLQKHKTSPFNVLAILYCIQFVLKSNEWSCTRHLILISKILKYSEFSWDYVEYLEFEYLEFLAIEIVIESRSLILKSA